MIESGILVMNKPQDFTSFDVIGKLRGILHMKKLGHTGTLDPMATGVLPVLVGTAARAADIMPDDSKRYLAAFRFGEVTDTQDCWGNVLSQSERAVSEAEILEILPQFCGDIMQIPPMYSAVQVNGKRLYELARAGKEVEREPRPVRVDGLTLLSYDAETRTGTMDIRCGKGTFIRTILHDIGQLTGAGCIMTALTRTEACGFTLSQAYTFDTVQKAADEGTLEPLIIPTDRLFVQYPALKLNEAQSRMYANGVKLSLNRIRNITKQDIYRVYGADGHFFGLASADRAEGLLRVYKNL
ncbi:MAG: tRNA pseudouridine(55) synthase TruB [Oscillospiraceae bacterium]|nr:tRNA pseudouridine(55) synthase TruB [Oscillospiraceae bacterium]